MSDSQLRATNPARSPAAIAGEQPAEAALRGQRFRSRAPESDDRAEAMLPITAADLIERLTQERAWPPGQAAEARRLFRQLSSRRSQQWDAELLELKRAYERFNPDGTSRAAAVIGEVERRAQQALVVEQMRDVLERAGYTRLDPSEIELLAGRDKHRGLDISVDFGAFEHCLIYHRGVINAPPGPADSKVPSGGSASGAPTFQRLFLLLEPKPLETRVRETMQSEKLDRKAAERRLRKSGQPLSTAGADTIYLKLFKNMPLSDIEIAFPNVRVSLRLKDKVRLGLAATGGVGVGAIGVAGKIATGGKIAIAAVNPLVLAGVIGCGGALLLGRALSLTRRRGQYLTEASRSLYFNTMADNRGAIATLADEAIEQETKEEMLLYSALAKERATMADVPALEAAIERYLAGAFDVKSGFHVEAALLRLIRDGLVEVLADGTLATLPPGEANARLGPPPAEPPPEAAAPPAPSPPIERPMAAVAAAPAVAVDRPVRAGEAILAPHAAGPKPRPPRIEAPAQSASKSAGGHQGPLLALSLLAGAIVTYAALYNGLLGRDVLGRLLATIGFKLNMFPLFGFLGKRKAMPAPPTDTVDCSVFSPDAAPPQTSVLVQVFLHVPEHAARAEAMAAMMDPTAARRGASTLLTPIARGAKVTVSLSATGLEVDEPEQTVTWRGEPVFCQFIVTLPQGSDGRTFHPVVRIAVSGGLVGCIKYRLKADARAAAPQSARQGDSARRYEHAFLSYASDDRKEVLKRAQALQAAGVSFFQDILTLDPGDRWQREIYKNIDRCDLFLLFWSHSAKRSEWVIKEAEYALRRRGDGELPDIIPIILDTPPPLPPPASLASLHFNDRIHYLINQD